MLFGVWVPHVYGKKDPFFLPRVIVAKLRVIGCLQEVGSQGSKCFFSGNQGSHFGGAHVKKGELHFQKRSSTQIVGIKVLNTIQIIVFGVKISIIWVPGPVG